MRILVTGPTGYVGSRLVAALLDNGHDVAAATRDPEKLGHFVPDDGALFEHLAGRAEVASALAVDGGPELVCWPPISSNRWTIR